jgi:hypothetical protein
MLNHSLQFDAHEDIEAKVARARQKELEMEARQKDIEDRAYWGLDGPRPCMYMGGKPVVGPSTRKAQQDRQKSKQKHHSQQQHQPRARRLSF